MTAFRPGDASAEERVYVANVHLSGGASPERRLRQVHGVTERVRKWQAAQKQAAAKAAKRRRGKADAARHAQETSPSPPSP